MVIGFTERRRTVSEGIVPAGLTYPVAALRTSERNHPMIFRLLEGSSTATVITEEESEDPDLLHNSDALFGKQREKNGPIKVSLNLTVGRTTLLQNLSTLIRDDINPEDDECYSVQIFAVDVPGVRQLFTCNSEADATDYFCVHEICIIDDDGKVYHIIISHLTLSTIIFYFRAI